METGKIKKLEPLLQVAIEENPFGLPRNWQWVRFSTIADFSAGRTPSRHDSSFWNTGDYPWVSIADMKDGGVIVTTKETVSTKAKDQVFNSQPIPSGTMIMSFKLTIGKISRLGIPAFHNEAIISIRPHFQSMDAFLFKVLPQFSREGHTKDAIKGATLNRESIANILLPLPPLAEQYRIVAKVDELMALCDRLGKAQVERESRRDRLVASSLNRLNNGADPDAFRNHARFYFNHLPRLTTKPEHIQQLRQTILNLAVRGKLVPQDPQDVPVAIAESSLKKKSDGRVSRDNLEDDSWPDNIPESWRWYRLGAISQQITDGEHATPPRIIEQQVPLVTAKNVRNGFMDYDDTDWVSFETASKAWSRCRPAVGDILLVCVGATTGRLCVLREARNMVLVRSVALIRPCLAIDVYYLALALRSPVCQTQIWEKVKVTAQPCLYIHRIKSLSIPMPPLAEQQRIVAKVNELMALCDQLEAQLTITQAENSRLLDSVLAELLQHDDAPIGGR